MIHYISPDHLELEQINRIITDHYKIELSEESIRRITACREYLDHKMADQREPIYGINTGFGSLCNIVVAADELSQLQHNLVVSHACGTGDEAPQLIVRIILLLKIQSLAYGYSGVQLCTVQRLVDMFNADVIPVIYEQGSLGASGDLAPLAHLSLPILGMGEVYYKGEKRETADIMNLLGWEPIRLQSKEGLALLNGTQFMSAYGVYAAVIGRRLSRAADTIAAISLDAFDGRLDRKSVV